MLEKFLTDPMVTSIVLGIVLVSLETLLDRIPDKHVPYVGFIRRVIRFYLRRKEERKFEEDR